MKVFITGASGYLGRAVVTELVKHGHSVVGLTRTSEGEAQLSALGATALRGDIKDLALLSATARQVDAVIHLAFDHTWSDPARAVDEEIAQIDAMGGALAESPGKIFIGTSGTIVGATANKLSPPAHYDENTPALGMDGYPRQKSESAIVALRARGVRSSVVRLPPMVHGGDMNQAAIILELIKADKLNGAAAYIDGITWTAVQVQDAAALYRRVLEDGARYEYVHGTGERVVLKDIAVAIGDKLNIPVKSVSPAEALDLFGFYGNLLALNETITGEITRQRLGWVPTHKGVLQALRDGEYFDQVKY